jgi:hypothetical protein
MPPCSLSSSSLLVRDCFALPRRARNDNTIEKGCRIPGIANEKDSQTTGNVNETGSQTTGNMNETDTI